MTSRLLSTTIAALVMATLAQAPAAAQYTFQTFSAPSNSYINAVNDNLYVGGYINGNNPIGYVRSPQGYSSTYNYPGADTTYFLGYNNALIVFGVAQFANGATTYFTINGTTVTNVTIDGINAVGLNNSNTFTGLFPGNSNTLYGYVQNLSGSAGAFPIGNLTSVENVSALSDNNDVVGVYTAAFLYGFLRTANGSVYTWTFPETDTMEVTGVNTSYNVVGNYLYGPGEQSQYSGYVIGNGGASMQLNVPGAVVTYVGGINNHGVIAGTAIIQATGAWVGFFAYPSGYTGVRSSAKPAEVNDPKVTLPAVKPAGLAAGLLPATTPTPGRAAARLLFKWPEPAGESPSIASASRIGAARRQAFHTAATSPARRLVVKPAAPPAPDAAAKARD